MSGANVDFERDFANGIPRLARMPYLDAAPSRVGGDNAVAWNHRLLSERADRATA